MLQKHAAAQAPADWRLTSKGADWPGFTAKFDKIETSGTLILQDANRGGLLIANGDRAKAGYLPGSTFKIPNTMIALQTGAAKDLDQEIFKYSGRPFLVEGKPFLPKACEADINLETAFKNSCVPVYQELARRIGAEAYKDWLTKFDYGNADVGGPLDSFWLDGALRISAIEQVKFLRRLVMKTLGVSPRANALTEQAMFIEKIGETSIHGKSGWVYSQSPATGWWIGFAQRGEDVVLIALNMDMPKREHAEARYRLVKEALSEAGVV
ncbi:penicillin-binding transpeptidase domain-containing protein [Terrarubrum flagellatum]|uniref:penicillin-binding transpeptidase domain-containing protein n=1 Tax=Terrirubrum flagellatum TaxID=2895980 RepID=UPI00314527DC